MTRDRDRFEDYPLLSEIKMSPDEREDIWGSIEQGMQRTRIHKTKRGIAMMKTPAAVVAALALCAGGIGYTMHHASLSTSPGVTTTASNSQTPRSTPQSTYASEITVIQSKGYSTTANKPNASVQTASGETLSAWIGTLSASQDGHNLRVLFFLNGKYVGTDAHASLEITSAKATGNGIAVTYPVYRASDSFAHPTGTPVTITYTWNGSKVVGSQPYPKQFQGGSTTTTSQGQSSITTTTYATTAEATSQIASVQGANGVGAGSPTVNLGNGIVAKESAGMGHARYVWQEGNWTIQIRFYTSNSNTAVKQAAQNIVAYLHTHMLPAPHNHGVIVVESTGTNTTGFQAKTTIAWQEGTKVYQLQQTGSPIQALQTVIHHG